MIHGDINPEEWKEEVARNRRMVNVTDTMAINEFDELVEFSFKIDTALAKARQVKEIYASGDYKFKKRLEVVTMTLEEELSQISELEGRLTKEHSPMIKKQKGSATSRKTCQAELYSLRDKVKNLISSFEEMSQECEEIYEEIGEKSKELNNTDIVLKAKKKLASIKTEIKKLNQRIGVIREVVLKK